jgi:hypothetical protein
MLSVFGRRIKGMIRLWPEQVWTCNVTLHVRTCSGRNRIIFLMRRPNTDSIPKKPVTLPRNQLLIRYAVTSPVHTVTLRCCDTRWLYKCVPTLNFQIPSFWSESRELTHIHFKHIQQELSCCALLCPSSLFGRLNAVDDVMLCMRSCWKGLNDRDNSSTEMKMILCWFWRHNC